MQSILKAIGLTLLTAVLGIGLPTLALSGTDRTVYDKPDVRPGKTINGKVVNVDEKSSQSWNVAVKDLATGEVVTLHVDKTTERREITLKPDLGDIVIVKYNEQNNHAYSFLSDERVHN